MLQSDPPSNMRLPDKRLKRVTKMWGRENQCLVSRNTQTVDILIHFKERRRRRKKFNRKEEKRKTKFE